ncbi:calcium-binding protein [Streptomyces griseus]|uniref:calcium-binding protein n=1 Tax=Streptomyces griseus TaxID=1911 RepID=UPI000559DFF1|nr:calcium-binding protein [Streptomyces griseus]
MRTHRTTTVTAALALCLGGAILSGPTAQAAPTATASLVHQEGELWYKAAPGQTNRLTVSAEVVPRTEFESDYVLTFRDRVGITLAAGECTYPSASDHTVARCVVPIPLGSDDSDIYDVDLGDRDDTATIPADNSAYAAIHGGSGNDVIRGSGASVLYGEAGNDRLAGGGGVWGLGSFGGPGDDTLTDCRYECHGGPGNDSLTGGAEEVENTLFGDDGNDVLHGRTGADVLYGGKGNDKLYGEQGNDVLYGNSGNDVLHGGPGRDRLSGGPGRDQEYQG